MINCLLESMINKLRLSSSGNPWVSFDFQSRKMPRPFQLWQWGLLWKDRKLATKHFHLTFCTYQVWQGWSLELGTWLNQFRPLIICLDKYGLVNQPGRSKSFCGWKDSLRDWRRRIWTKIYQVSFFFYFCR